MERRNSNPPPTSKRPDPTPNPPPLNGGLVSQRRLVEAGGREAFDPAAARLNLPMCPHCGQLAPSLGKATQLDRIEHMQKANGDRLDALLAALAAEGDEEQDTPATTLDGEPVPGERDQSQSLG